MQKNATVRGKPPQADKIGLIEMWKTLVRMVCGKNKDDYALVMRKQSIFVCFIIGHFYVPVADFY